MNIIKARHSGKLHSSVSLTAITVAMIMAGGAAQAEEGFFLEEIVVTARNRVETLQSVPISITAFSSESLDNRGIEDLSSLTTQTPGVVFAEASGISSKRPIIRGLSQNTSVGDEANVAVFVDGIYSPGFSGVDVGFDGLERVEVVRGPQSALYGRNSFAGAVNYITKRPGNELEYGGRGTYGMYGRWHASAFGSAPIMGEKLAVRVDGGLSSTGGAFRNKENGDRLGDNDAKFARVGMRSRPNEVIDIFASFSYRKDEATATPLVVIADDDPRRAGKPPASARSPIQVGRRVAGPITDWSDSFSFLPHASSGDRTTYRGVLNMEMDLGGALFTSLTGYERRYVSTLTNLDQTPEGTLFSGRWVRTASGDNDDRENWSQDFRLQSKDDQRLKWLFGAYYSHEDLTAQRMRYSSELIGSSRSGVISPAPKPDHSPWLNEETISRATFKSIYASLNYDLTDAFSLSVEGRQTWETKASDNTQHNYGSGAGQLLPYMKETFSYFTPRFIINYEPQQGLLLYASVAEGVKSGGFNDAAVIEEEYVYDLEKNWTYEIGGKFNFLNRRALLNISAFYIDWTSQQVMMFAQDGLGGYTSSSIVGNVGSSRVKGFEAQGLFVATEWLRLDGSYTLTDAKFKDAVQSNFAGWVDCDRTPRLECVNGMTTGRVDGNQLPYTSKHAFALGAEVNMPLTDDWALYLRGDYTWSSKRYNDAGNIGWIPAKEDLRLRAGIQNDHWKFQVFCENVTKDKTPVSAFASRDFSGNPHYYARVRDPRLCGATVLVKY